MKVDARGRLLVIEPEKDRGETAEKIVAHPEFAKMRANLLRCGVFLKVKGIAPATAKEATQ